MKSRTQAKSIFGLLCLSVLGLVSVSAPAEAVPCGPGAHWVDNCAAGTDMFFSQTSHGLVVFDPEDGGMSIPLPLLTGPTTIVRQAGTTVPDHHIDVEMVALNLTQVGGGLTLRAGVTFGLRPSPGRITELPDTTTAHSWFDVFFEIFPIPIFGPLHNNVACRMTADITVVPPIGFEYLGCHDPRLSTDTMDGPLYNVDLFDALGEHRAILTSGVIHLPLFDCGLPGLPGCPPAGTPVPEPATLLLVLAGLSGLAAREQLTNAKRAHLNLVPIAAKAIKPART